MQKISHERFVAALDELVCVFYNPNSMRFFCLFLGLPSYMSAKSQHIFVYNKKGSKTQKLLDIPLSFSILIMVYKRCTAQRSASVL